MKTIITLIITSFLLNACNRTAIIPAKLVNKWEPTYMFQDKKPDGSWDNWHRINTFVPLPQIEFTADGRFLRNGEKGADCCYAGNLYKVTNNKIFFSDIKSCPLVLCAPCPAWTIEKLDSDTLVLDQCNSKSKYFRLKQ